MREKLSLITCLKNRRYLSCKIRRRKETKRRRLKGKKYRKMTQTVAIEWEMTPSEKFRVVESQRLIRIVANPARCWVKNVSILSCINHSSLPFVWRRRFSEWVCIIIVQHTQTNRSSRHFFSNFEDRTTTTTTAEEKEKSQNVINDIMRNRGAWFRAVTESAQRHSLKYKRSSTRNERRSIAECLAWDYETMRRQRNDRECLLGRSQTDAHGGSLVARLKFHSFHFMVFNQLHRIFSSLSRPTRSEENQWKPAKARKWDTE